MMRYPRYPSQPNSGDLPPGDTWPVDLRPSGHNPYYDVYKMTKGRFLGSLGDDAPRSQQAPTADQGITDYANELNTLSAEDDVSGNGIFDPAGAQQNLHPDTGVFADSASIPGYLARERFYAPSEVTDVNTGKPVMYVPGGGGFMMDPRTQWMVDDAALYYPGMPNTGGQGVEQLPTVQPMQPAWPVTPPMGQSDENEKARAGVNNMLVAGAIGGLAIGLVWGMTRKKRK